MKVLLQVITASILFLWGISFGQSTYNFPLEADPPTLDPAILQGAVTLNILNRIYEPLMQLDPETGLPVPGLAKSVDVSEDGLSYTFSLQNGVTFHNGSPVTAEIVKEALERQLTNPSNYYSFLFSSVEGLAEAQENCCSISGISVIDNQTLQINLSQPNSVLLASLAFFPAFISDPSVEDLGETPMGTGPYKFVSREQGSEIVLEAYDGYWGEKPGIDRIVFKVIPETSAQVLEFEAGNLDHLMVPPSDVRRYRTDPPAGVSVQEKDTLVTTYYRFNQTRSPLDNVLVRQAMNYAINREAIADIVLQGLGAPLGRLFPEGIPGRSDDLEGYSYDPEKAKSLLAEAGYPDGLAEPITLTFETDDVGVRVAQAVQADLAKIGITLNIETLEFGLYISRLDNAELDMGRIVWGADYTDPDAFVTFNVTQAGSLELAGYKNEELDALALEAVTLPNGDERNALYKRIEEIILEDAPILPLTSSHAVLAVAPGVEGVFIDSLGVIHIENASK
ncbi:MAG: ABC transporter substrate-binding protein [Trueperaceae bacterium]|nr:ABC transporter substrate-binding protein [Trueperaceae bacterium]